MFTLQDINWVMERLGSFTEPGTLEEAADNYTRYLSVKEKFQMLMDDHPVDEEKEEKKKVIQKKKAPVKKK